jgi:L-threonylcarbamoyladenylate synthase
MAPRTVDAGEAVRILQSGGLILMATDTLPGFHCRADDSQAVARIAAIKGRGEGKPLLVLAGSIEQAGYVTGPLDDRQGALTKACWPGPFSIILPARAGLAREVTAGSRTVAVRVPGLEFVRQLVLDAGFPVVSTSANLAGEAPALELTAAGERFGHLVDGILDPGLQRVKSEAVSADSGRLSGPSALVDATVWPPAVLRDGPAPLPAMDPRS